jgi:hypothetical protein
MLTRIRFRNAVARVFFRVEQWAARGHERFATCETCGGNLWSDPPCFGRDVDAT